MKTLLRVPPGYEGEAFEVTKGITSIGDRAFYGCHSLQSIIIPSSVTTIGEEVFSDCKSLKTVKTSLKGPAREMLRKKVQGWRTDGSYYPTAEAADIETCVELWKRIGGFRYLNGRPSWGQGGWVARR